MSPESWNHLSTALKKSFQTIQSQGSYIKVCDNYDSKFESSKAISASRETKSAAAKIGTSDFVAWGISNLIHPSLQMDLTCSNFS